MADCIDREAVLDYIRYKVCQGEGNIEHRCQRGSCAYCGIAEIMSDISCMPASDVQSVKHGRWEYFKNNGIINTYICSNCENKVEMAIDVEPSSFCYCPKCGANMREADATKG